MPGNTLRDAHKLQKMQLGAAAPGFDPRGPAVGDFRCAALTKTPRIGRRVNSNREVTVQVV